MLNPMLNSKRATRRNKVEKQNDKNVKILCCYFSENLDLLEFRWKPAMEGGELSLGIKNPETNKTCKTKVLGEQQRQKVQDLPQTRIPTRGKGAG